MYHALGILALGILSNEAFLRLVCFLGQYIDVCRIVFFSGSLYVLAVTGVKKLGAITPIGGMLFIVAWVLVIIAAFA